MIDSQPLFLPVDLFSKPVVLKLEAASESLEGFKYRLLGPTLRVSELVSVKVSFICHLG